MNIVKTSPVLLMSVPTGVVRDLAAHVLACHLHSEESPIGTHAELVAHPLPSTKLVPTGGTRQASGADHHGSIQDDAVFLEGE